MIYVGVNPFERREEFTRHNKTWVSVIGVNNLGEGYIWFEEKQLIKGAIQQRWVATKVLLGFTRGVNKQIESYWQPEKYIDGEFIEGTNGPEERMKTNIPDQILFTPQLGVAIMFSMAGGFVRERLGFDDQPLFNGGVRIPDSEYDTTMPPSNTYGTRLPQVVINAEESETPPNSSLIN